MELLPTLHRITVYPIKSLDGVELSHAALTQTGSLEDDRRYALVDEDGRFINGKRTAAIHAIRASFNLSERTVELRASPASDANHFSLVDNHHELGEWFSTVLHMACSFVQNDVGGFPDDTDAPGPTLLSTATLQTVADWFPGLSLDEVRRRFRANLEINGVEPFWEDRLAGPQAAVVSFRIGQSRWLGVNPCQRCVVPTRDSETGAAITLFQKTFAQNREATLPIWSTRHRFDHFYRLAVNTRAASSQATDCIAIGDTVELT